MGQSMGQPKTLTTGTTNGTIKCGQPKTLVKWDIQRDNQMGHSSAGNQMGQSNGTTEDISQMGHSLGQSGADDRRHSMGQSNGTLWLLFYLFVN